MRINEWDARYRSGERAKEDVFAEPTPLVTETAGRLAPGAALDVACGAGRNAIWLAAHGWDVTGVDGSEAAIEILRHRAGERGVHVQAQVADLEIPGFKIEPESWDLIMKCYYLQRSLFPVLRTGVAPGGVVIAIVHLAAPGEKTTYKHAAAGELQGFFEGWEVLHYFEGAPSDASHKRPVAEIVARKPGN